MKRVLVIIVFALSVVCMYSQANGKSTKVPTKGYRGFVDLSGEALFEKKYSDDRDIVYSVSGFTTTHGYQFDEHFFVGGGIGMNLSTSNYESATFAIYYPIFAAGRIDWNIGKVPLFADLRFGTFIKAISDYNKDRLYINPSVGYHCSWGRRVSLNIGVGVSVHWIERYEDSGWKFMPSAKIGIEFY